MAADVRLRLRGLMPERFLQRATSLGVQLEDVRRAGDREVSFSASEADAQKLLALAEKYQLDLSVVERRGFSLLKRRLIQRPSLPLSMLMSVALVAVFLSRLWLIELPADANPALAQSLRALGVRPGISRASVDTREIEQALYAQSGDYAFVGARLDGVRLKLTLVLELPEPELYDRSESRDLVASRDAVLLSINAFSGQAEAKPGDTVRRGQLLIRGEEKVSDEVTHGVCALGEAIGRAWLTAESRGALTEATHVLTGRISLESELRLFDYSVPLVMGQGFDSEQIERQRLPVGGLYLPLQIVRTLHQETQITQKSVNPEALKRALSGEAMQNALGKVPSNAEIVDKWVDYSMIGEELICARAVVEVRQNIAVSRSALTVGGK